MPKLVVPLRTVVELHKKTEIQNALAGMEGIEDLENNSIEYFAKMKLATTQVIDELLPGEREELEAEGRSWGTQGYPADLQKK